MRQYGSIKQRYPETLLFFRLGDFYELFYEDAVTAARELEITLTSRNKEKGVAIPMCGVPYHAAEGYVNKLIRKGYRVAICDQVEDAKLAKTLVKREVTRVVTPGTAIDAGIASARENNYLGAIARKGESVALALADLSTGDFRVTEFSGPDAAANLNDELERMLPREVLLSRGQATQSSKEPASTDGNSQQGYHLPVPTYLDEWVFEPDYCRRILREQLGVADLTGLGLDGRPLALAAAGAIIHYVRETQRAALAPPGPSQVLPPRGLPAARPRYPSQPRDARADVRQFAGNNSFRIHGSMRNFNGIAPAPGLDSAPLARPL